MAIPKVGLSVEAARAGSAIRNPRYFGKFGSDGEGGFLQIYFFFVLGPGTLKIGFLVPEDLRFRSGNPKSQ